MTTATSPTSNLLRLAQCPKCDYSLEGLPEAGICPECGRAYDQSVVIVPVHRSEKFSAYLGLVLAVMVVAPLLWSTLMYPPISGAAGNMIWWSFLNTGLLGLMFGMDWFEAVTSLRKGAWRLWITPLGVGLKRRSPNAFIARCRTWLNVLGWPAYLPVAAATMVPRGYWAILACCGIALLLLSVVLHLYRERRLIPAAGAQPQLFPWARVKRIQLLERAEQSYRLHIWLGGLTMLDATFRGSQWYAMRLRRRLEQWSRKSVE